MAHQPVKEHHISSGDPAAGNLAAIERIYRCANDYGAIVYSEPLGSELADRLLVTPVHFSSEDDNSYLILSAEEVTEGVTSGSLLRPKFVFTEEEVDAILDKLCAYTQEGGEHGAAHA